MKNSESKTDLVNSVGELGSALFELRDALLDLSLALKDLQFEVDVEKRALTQQAVQQLMQQLTLPQDSAL